MKLILLSLLIMFSSKSVARAFSTYAAVARPALQPRLVSFSGVFSSTARPMSSDAGAGAGPDTSVVNTCLKKIQEALGSDNVQVTGTCTCTSDVTSRWILSFVVLSSRVSRDASLR